MADDDYIEVKFKIKKDHLSLRFGGEGAPLIKWFKEQFEKMPYNGDAAILHTIKEMEKYLNRMKNIQHYWFLFCDENVEVLEVKDLSNNFFITDKEMEI